MTGAYPPRVNLSGDRFDALALTREHEAAHVGHQRFDPILVENPCRQLVEEGSCSAQQASRMMAPIISIGMVKH